MLSRFESIAKTESSEGRSALDLTCESIVLRLFGVSPEGMGCNTLVGHEGNRYTRPNVRFAMWW